MKMTNQMKFFFISLLVFSSFGLFLHVQAAELIDVANTVAAPIRPNIPASQINGFGTQSSLLAPIPGMNASATTDLKTYLQNLFKFIIGGAGVLAVLFVFWGGFEYATSDAVTGKSDAKKRIENALYGLGLTLAAWLVLYTINPQLLSLKVSDIQQQKTTAVKSGDMNTWNQEVMDRTKSQNQKNAETNAKLTVLDTKIYDLDSKLSTATTQMNDLLNQVGNPMLNNDGSIANPDPTKAGDVEYQANIRKIQELYQQSNQVRSEKNSVQSERDTINSAQKVQNYQVIAQNLSSINSAKTALTSKEDFDFLQSQSNTFYNTSQSISNELTSPADKTTYSITQKTTQTITDQTIIAGTVKYDGATRSLTDFKSLSSQIDTRTKEALDYTGQTEENKAALKANAEAAKSSIRSSCITYFAGAFTADCNSL